MLLLNRCQYCTRCYVQDIEGSKCLDKSFCLERNFFCKEFINRLLADEIYLNFHYTGKLFNNYGKIYKTKNFETLFYESVNCSFTLYRQYLEIFVKVSFKNFNRKILPIFIKGYFDKKRKYAYESFRLKFTSQYLRKTSKLACKCIKYINANVNPTYFENIFITYRKNIDYTSPNVDMNNNCQ